MKQRRAMTLLEVVFVSGVLGLFVMMVGRALVMGFRAHQRTMDRSFAYRRGSVAMSRILREISSCGRWTAPAIGSGVVHPLADGDLIWARTTAGYSPAGDITQLKPVRYWRNAATSELIRKDPNLPGGTRAEAKDVTDFTVEVLPGVVKVTLAIKNNAVPLVIVGNTISM